LWQDFTASDFKMMRELRKRISHMAAWSKARRPYYIPGYANGKR